MSIGTTIKKLRKEKNITQEQLAEYLGITSRAVSQWECDRTAPDISQLPALANIFEVSADVLLGIDVTQKEKRTEEIIKEANRHRESGHTDEAINTLRSGLKEFPNSYVLMGNLLSCLRTLIMKPEKKEALLQEGILLGEKILEECTNDKERHNAIHCLCYFYREKGEPEKAIALAEKMPSLFSNAEYLFSTIHTDRKRLEYIKCTLSAIFSMIYNELWLMNDPLDDGTSPYTNKEYIEILKKYPAIMDIILEDKNYGLFAIHLIGTNTKLAQYYIREQEVENALNALNAAAKYAIWYDTQFQTLDAYTCLLLRDHSFGHVLTDSNENQCLILLHRLEESPFDSVREQPAFRKITEELQKYAKEL